MGIPASIIKRYRTLHQRIVSKVGLTTKFSQRVIDRMDREVAEKKYASKAEFIVEAVNLLLDKEALLEESKLYLKSHEFQDYMERIVDAKVKQILQSPEYISYIKDIVRKEMEK